MNLLRINIFVVYIFITFCDTLNKHNTVSSSSFIISIIIVNAIFLVLFTLHIELYSSLYILRIISLNETMLFSKTKLPPGRDAYLYLVPTFSHSSAARFGML